MSQLLQVLESRLRVDRATAISISNKLSVEESEKILHLHRSRLSDVEIGSQIIHVILAMRQRQTENLFAQQNIAALHEAQFLYRKLYS